MCLPAVSWSYKHRRCLSCDSVAPPLDKTLDLYVLLFTAPQVNVEVRCVSDLAGRSLFAKTPIKPGEPLAIIPTRLCIGVKDYTLSLAVSGGQVDG